MVAPFERGSGLLTQPTASLSSSTSSPRLTAMTRQSERYVQWNRVATELRACRDAQLRAWGDLDDVQVARYLAGICSSEERATIEQAMQSLPDAREVIQVLRAVGPELQFAPPQGGPDRLARRPEAVILGTPWKRAVMGTGIAAALLSAIGMLLIYFEQGGSTQEVKELLASHVRSQMLPGHLVDFPSSNQHVVKPWFEGKLDFSPAVNDLTDQGFPLVGGRLDYLDNRQVAALVYKRRQHVINLFMWPATTSAEAAPKMVVRQGYNLVHWTESGMSYWAVSDLNEADLQMFVGLVRHSAK
jgi:anti-sigma factor RsiW